MQSTHLLCIQYNFLELASLSKTLNDFIRDICSQIHTESESWVHRFHQITQLFRALQLKQKHDHRHSHILNILMSFFFFYCKDKFQDDL